MYSDRLDLAAYFRDNPCEHCILRMPEHLPQYAKGSDLDILCEDIDAMVKYTLTFALDYTDQELRVERSLTRSGHTHVDMFTATPGLELRFDLIDNLQGYKKFAVDDKLMDAVMAHRVRKYGAWVPDAPYDLALRYMEYAEHYPARLGKIKHLRYVQARPEVDFWPILKRHTSLKSR